ncbi:hypothetical protein [Methanogenium cariaci]|nr:hypothetical protein [Methanogenium cariaci]
MCTSWLPTWSLPMAAAWRLLMAERISPPELSAICCRAAGSQSTFSAAQI